MPGTRSSRPEAVHAVALEELQVSVDVPPLAITAGLAVKVAVGTTFTVALARALVPPGPEQVSLNVELESNRTGTLAAAAKQALGPAARACAGGGVGRRPRQCGRRGRPPPSPDLPSTSPWARAEY